MTRYLISFDDGAMTFPEEDLPAVAAAAHAVVDEAKAAGAWVFGAGVTSKDGVSVVAVDGTVATAPRPRRTSAASRSSRCSTRKDALRWAAKIAGACRCAQDVRELVPDVGDCPRDCPPTRRGQAKSARSSRKDRRVSSKGTVPGTVPDRGLVTVVARVSSTRRCPTPLPPEREGDARHDERGDGDDRGGPVRARGAERRRRREERTDRSDEADQAGMSQRGKTVQSSCATSAAPARSGATAASGRAAGCARFRSIRSRCSRATAR